MPKVLFVCTGNICRSPMAEALLRHQMAQEGLDDWEVASAGTWTMDGVPASRYAIEVMARRDLDLSLHRSREVNRRLLEEADLVLVMTNSQREALIQEFLDQRDKIFMLSEMKNGHRYDIDDPYGGPLEEYEACLEALADLIEGGVERIRFLAEQRGRAENPAD